MRLRGFIGRVFAAVAISLVTLSAWAINPDNLNRITFENNTGYDIVYLYLSPGDSDCWGTDILGTTRTLDDGDELGFFIHYPDRCNEFDILAVDEDGDGYEIFDFELCDGDEALVDLNLSDLTDSRPEFDLVEITIENETDYEMWYVFFSPGDSDMWGVDQLDETTTLGPGDTLQLYLPASRSSTSYDIHAVDEDEDTYTFSVAVDNSEDAFWFSISYDSLD